jgi:hypothetical protein
MTTSAHFGDKKGFLAGFDEKSRTLMDGMIVLSEAYGMTGSSPYALLVFDSVERETRYDKGKTFGKQFKCDKPCAVLRVKTKRRKRNILMLQTDEGWQLNLKALQEYWKSPEGRKTN